MRVQRRQYAAIDAREEVWTGRGSGSVNEREGLMGDMAGLEVGGVVNACYVLYGGLARSSSALAAEPGKHPPPLSFPCARDHRLTDTLSTEWQVAPSARG
jgi:hypothetical protein